MIGLGIDAGGSATRWVLSDADGTVIRRGDLPPVTGHLFNPQARSRFDAMLAELRDMVAGELPARVIAGITGLSASAPEAGQAVELLAAALGIAPERVFVTDDVWVACRTAFAPGEGHVVYAGSGSIGVHVRADGTSVRVGGRGMLIDDGGSAFWIGREALCLVWRRIDDGITTPSQLADALFAAIGGGGWDQVRAFVYGGERRAVAMLAMAVAQADDADARAILRRAGMELARLGQALIRREGVRPVALVGRAATLHPEIGVGFREAAPEIAVQVVEVDAALSAARMAGNGTRITK